jgi:hypothetical protein
MWIVTTNNRFLERFLEPQAGLGIGRYREDWVW